MSCYFVNSFVTCTELWYRECSQVFFFCHTGILDIIRSISKNSKVKIVLLPRFVVVMEWCVWFISGFVYARGFCLSNSWLLFFTGCSALAPKFTNTVPTTANSSVPIIWCSGNLISLVFIVVRYDLPWMISPRTVCLSATVLMTVGSQAICFSIHILTLQIYESETGYFDSASQSLDTVYSLYLTYFHSRRKNRSASYKSGYSLLI